MLNYMFDQQLLVYMIVQEVFRLFVVEWHMVKDLQRGQEIEQVLH